MDEERPKRSWRDLDRKRDESAHRKGEGKPRGRPQQQSQAYRSYKTQLNKMFDGGALPDALKEKLAEAPVSEETKEQREALAKVRDASPARFEKELGSYFRTHGAPADEEILTQGLGIDDEELLVDVIQALTVRMEEGALKRNKAVAARLRTVYVTHDDPEVVEAAKKLEKLLK